MAKHRIVETEGAQELVERVLVTLDVEQEVVGLVNLGDGMRQLDDGPNLPGDE